MHHAVYRHFPVHQRDQRAPGRKARNKGFGAVDRVQHPDIFGILALVAEFLADNAMLREIGLDQPAHHRFGGAVGFRHGIEIAGAFIVDAKRRPEERQNGFAGGSRKAANEGGEIDDRHDDSLAHGSCGI